MLIPGENFNGVYCAKAFLTRSKSSFTYPASALSADEYGIVEVENRKDKVSRLNQDYAGDPYKDIVPATVFLTTPAKVASFW